MKKGNIVLIIVFLIFLTTFIKNSTKKIDEEIYLTKENVSFLRNQFEMLKLEYDYLSSPKKLLEYQKNYFDEQLIPIDVNKLGLIFFDYNLIFTKHMAKN